jgi:hypothetical protein
MRSFVRHMQGVLTRILPHPGNQRIAVPGLIGGQGAKPPATRFDLTQFPLDPRITFTRNSGGFYYSDTGQLLLAATNVPRPYRLPSGGQILGLMIEESATNKLLWSSDFANAAWIKFGGATINSNVATAPDGSQTADRLNFAGVGGIYQSPAAIDGETNFNSFFLRADAPGNVRLVANTSLSDPVSVVCAVTTEWQRFNISKLMSVGSVNCACQIDNNTAGALGSVYMWGADQCAEQVLTSHIETGESPVTRQADVASVIGVNFSSWFNPVEGTFRCYGKTDMTYVGTNQFPFMFSAQVAVNTERISTSIRVISTYSDCSTATIAGGVNQNIYDTLSQDNPANVAYAYKSGDFATSVNGKAAQAGTPQGTLPTVDRMFIGSQSGSGNFINGYIASIDYWNTRLPNQRLVELTGGGGISGDIIPVNTVAPAITGIPSSSNVLTCSTGTWTNAVSYTYRWYNGNTPILGQINSTMTITNGNAPVGSKITCAVTAHSSTGNLSTAISNEVTVV